MFLMRILTPSLALVLGLALAPAAAMAQNANLPATPNPNAAITGQAPVSVGSGANNSEPSGGPALKQTAKPKYHKRSHKHFYGKHHDYARDSPKGPTEPQNKTTGTTN
jgi:hypothetical protein